MRKQVFLPTLLLNSLVLPIVLPRLSGNLSMSFSGVRVAKALFILLQEALPIMLEGLKLAIFSFNESLPSCIAHWQ